MRHHRRRPPLRPSNLFDAIARELHGSGLALPFTIAIRNASTSVMATAQSGTDGVLKVVVYPEPRR